MTAEERGGKRRAGIWSAGAAIIVAGVFGYRAIVGPGVPDIPLVDVRRSDFVERLDLRGEVRPIRSVLINAPGNAGDLLIVQLARSGTEVGPGDPIATFNPIVLRQQIEDKRNEVRQAEAEMDRTRASARISSESNRTALLKAQYDVERAKLAMGDEKLMPRLDFERARLDVVNAEQRLHEIEQKLEAARFAEEADVIRRQRQINRVTDELGRLEKSLAAMQVNAPVGGTVHIMTGRSNSPGQMPQEFREGDRAWPGAAIAELPDLSSIFVRAQLGEDLRGRLELGQPALVKLDAIPDRELRGTVSDISVLARIEPQGGFPPPRNFELKVRIDDPDSRVKPGMSAMARIEVDRLPGALIVPADAVFDVNGRAVVYRLDGRMFLETPIEIAKRSREEIAVAKGLSEGDRIAREQPAADSIRRRQ